MAAADPGLVKAAREVVAATLRELPAPLRETATPLPVLYEPWPNDAIVADGYDRDLLGLFVGETHAAGGGHDLPAQIILFIENLWDFAEGDEAVFREEVRTTYLHELGHYLGLDEEELDERGLL
jgi:predicted Zn-dependent protease with MMP-like domain